MLKRVLCVIVALCLVVDPTIAGVLSQPDSGIAPAAYREQFHSQALISRLVPYRSHLNRGLLRFWWDGRSFFDPHSVVPRFAVGIATAFAILQYGIAQGAQAAAQTVALIASGATSSDALSATGHLTTTVRNLLISYSKNDSFWSIFSHYQIPFNSKNIQAFAEANENSVQYVETPQGGEWWLLDRGPANLLKVPEHLINNVQDAIKPFVDQWPLPTLEPLTEFKFEPSMFRIEDFTPTHFEIYAPMVLLSVVVLGVMGLAGWWIYKSVRSARADTSPYRKILLLDDDPTPTKETLALSLTSPQPKSSDGDALMEFASEESPTNGSARLRNPSDAETLGIDDFLPENPKTDQTRPVLSQIFPMIIAFLLFGTPLSAAAPSRMGSDSSYGDLLAIGLLASLPRLVHVLGGPTQKTWRVLRSAA